MVSKMQSKQELVNNLFASSMQEIGDIDGVELQLNTMGLEKDIVAKAKQTYLNRQEKIRKATPALKSDQNLDWYFGASKYDKNWNLFVRRMEDAGKGFLMKGLDESSTQIVNLTPNPLRDNTSYRGLVVGNVQSGKTNSFTAVAAKLADKKYQLVIVFAGIHNSLRNQTQKRLETFLTNDNRWFKITDENTDFNLVTLKQANDENFYVDNLSNSVSTYLHAKDKTSLIVAKKNATVLRKLRKWLGASNAKKLLENSWALVIDDEADQASVESGTINPLIQDILKLLPRSTYIGYTATPFANVFIDPENTSDLYPRDFIYSLPKGTGYFGAEELFGIRAGEEGEESQDGFDMVRIVPVTEEAQLRPQGKDEVATFQADMTPSLRQCFNWFILATAARRTRGDYGHSSMLVHTSFQIDVHRSFKEHLFEPYVTQARNWASQGDSVFYAELEAQWVDETKRVDGSFWNRTVESFDDIRGNIPGVLRDLQVIEDNYQSDVRLSYDDAEDGYGKVILAIGGNTLSRGLTLEGLVASLFIRPSNTYDTLLQMGRWFGYRPGYEDLPRIWTTEELHHDFRHLSLVEKELRDDIESYRLSGLTPMEMAVKVRTHDSLRITSKMGAARPAAISYAGSAIETTRFDNDIEIVAQNFDKGVELINRISGYRQPRALGKAKNPGDLIGEKGILFENVRQIDVIDFIEKYQFAANDSTFDVDLIRRYIDKQMGRGDGSLTKWNVVLRQGAGSTIGSETEFTYKEFNNLRMSVRNPLNDGKHSLIDIYSLRPSADYLIEIDNEDKKTLPAPELKRMRAEDPITKDKGLLILYPIDNKGVYASGKTSASDVPLRIDMKSIGLVTPLMGFAMIFPELSCKETEESAVRPTHYSVQYKLPFGSEQVDISDEMHGEDE